MRRTKQRDEFRVGRSILLKPLFLKNNQASKLLCGDVELRIESNHQVKINRSGVMVFVALACLRPPSRGVVSNEYSDVLPTIFDPSHIIFVPLLHVCYERTSRHRSDIQFIFNDGQIQAETVFFHYVLELLLSLLKTPTRTYFIIPRHTISALGSNRSSRTWRAPQHATSLQ